MTELLLGCGFKRDKLMGLPGSRLVWQDLVTLDCNRRCAPHLVCDLDAPIWQPDPITSHGAIALRPLFFDPPNAFRIRENYFDEIHAYEVLEHLGRQGEAATFFSTFQNIHDLLKPGGHLFATCPSRYSAWAWGDPSHRRVITPESLSFLDQTVVRKNREANTAMSDFSDLWALDFRVIASTDDHRTHAFCLQAVK